MSGVDGGRWLTRAAAHVLRHDAAEVPEARLAAVALLAAHARLAGALAGGRVTRALVGTVDVALAGTWWVRRGESLVRPSFCCRTDRCLNVLS